MGARNAGNPVACDVKGTGDVVWVGTPGPHRRETTKAPPDERGGNRYVLPNATAPHLDSTLCHEKAACNFMRDEGRSLFGEQVAEPRSAKMISDGRQARAAVAVATPARHFGSRLV